MGGAATAVHALRGSNLAERQPLSADNAVELSGSRNSLKGRRRAMMVCGASWADACMNPRCNDLNRSR